MRRSKWLGQSKTERLVFLVYFVSAKLLEKRDNVWTMRSIQIESVPKFANFSKTKVHITVKNNETKE